MKLFRNSGINNEVNLYNAAFSIFHSCVVSILSVLCLCGFVKEISICLFSGIYFFIDLFNEISKRRYLFIAHHIFALGSFYYACTTPGFSKTLSAAKGLICEFSTPLLHLDILYKDGRYYESFSKVFICVRLLWFPVVLIWNNVVFTDYPLVATYIGITFWFSNLCWFYGYVRKNRLRLEEEKRLDKY